VDRDEADLEEQSLEGVEANLSIFIGGRDHEAEDGADDEDEVSQNAGHICRDTGHNDLGGRRRNGARIGIRNRGSTVGAETPFERSAALGASRHRFTASW
jgi:hypothetical protein